MKKKIGADGKLRGVPQVEWVLTMWLLRCNFRIGIMPWLLMCVSHFFKFILEYKFYFVKRNYG
ncbi:MAG: hypothetical protein CVU39_20880 [Chloroflexi bacterium HGW-Chloroflexi-10]|nr:MAG: hypothetical protein CVU39_20880 [Chloroflexi bacterium HGW-Chloroflexi-10]